MSAPYTRRWSCLLTCLLAFPAGCNRQDTECLARIGRKTVARAGTLTGDFRESLSSGWQGVCAAVDDSGLEGRVATRLRWERGLADTRIDVRIKDGAIELSGNVADLQQRRRAVALAETTAGVDKVVDLLRIPVQAP